MNITREQALNILKKKYSDRKFTTYIDTSKTKDYSDWHLFSANDGVIDSSLFAVEKTSGRTGKLPFTMWTDEIMNSPKKQIN